MTAGTRVRCGANGGFAHWQDFDIPWRLNTANQGFDKEGAIIAALATWTGATNSDYNLFYGGVTTDDFVTDGNNTALWAVGNGCVGGCLALTALDLEAGQVIVEADVTFNELFDWRIDGATSTPRR